MDSSADTARILDEALLRADPDTLTETQRDRRAALEAARKPAPPPSRPRTADAAARQIGLLPPAVGYAIGADRTLRDSEAAVLALLCRHAWAASAATVAPSVPALAGELECSERTVQLAARVLAGRGLIAVTERPVRRGHNLSNLYRITGPRLLAAFARPSRRRRERQGETARQGETDLTQDSEPIPKDSSPYSHRITSNTTAQCKPAQQTDQPRPDTGANPKRRYRLPDKGAHHELSANALHQIAPQLAAQAQASTEPGAIWDAWTRLRDEKIRGFNPTLWNRAVAVHGTRAYLAVAETLLKTQAGQITHPAGYLWGILKRGIVRGSCRQDCQPETSVAEILAERAAGPAATKAAVTAALLEGLATRPAAEREVYLRRAGPEDRRRAGRLARRGDSAGFAAAIAAVIAPSAQAPATRDGPAGPAWDRPLPAETHEAARRAAPGWDVYAIEAEWRAWCAKRAIALDRPRAHFVAFARSWAQRRSGPRSAGGR